MLEEIGMNQPLQAHTKGVVLLGQKSALLTHGDMQIKSKPLVSEI